MNTWTREPRVVASDELEPVQPASVRASARWFALGEQARGASTATDAVAKPNRERRNPSAPQDKASLRSGLTAAQVDALSTLEQFGWSLRYVRRPMFQAPVPIVFSPDESRFVVLEDNGSINENPGFKLRP